MNHAFSLTDRVAVVTGAAGLLGRQHCAALAECGAKVIAADVDRDGAQHLASELSATFDAEVVAVQVDVTDNDSVQALSAVVQQRFARIDVLVNNAAIDDKVHGSDSLCEVEDYPQDEFRRILDVNVVGPFLCCQAFLRHMRARKGGSIINVASTYGIVAPQQSLYVDNAETQTRYKSPAYPVSKAAVIHLTRYLAAHFGRWGIRVNTLSPGGVESSQPDWFKCNYAARTPLGRMAAPSDYRGALLFLASHASSYMTGANLVVDGGWTVW